MQNEDKFITIFRNELRKFTLKTINANFLKCQCQKQLSKHKKNKQLQNQRKGKNKTKMIGKTKTLLLSTIILLWICVDRSYGDEKAIAAGIIWKVKPYYWKDDKNQSKGMVYGSERLFHVF